MPATSLQGVGIGRFLFFSPLKHRKRGVGREAGERQETEGRGKRYIYMHAYVQYIFLVPK